MSLKLISCLSNSERRPAQSCTQHLLIILRTECNSPLCVPGGISTQSQVVEQSIYFQIQPCLLSLNWCAFLSSQYCISSSKSLSWLPSQEWRVFKWLMGCWETRICGLNPSLAVPIWYSGTCPLWKSGSWKNTEVSPPKVWVLIQLWECLHCVTWEMA